MSRQDSTKISDVKVLLKMGSDGSGIASIEKTGSSLNVDTYTITLDDGRKTTFTVTNGTSIASIEKTSTVGLVDTYTITLTDGSTSTFEVVNGEGSTASTVPYDNTVSELTATNVQDAIDEIDATVDGHGEAIDGIDAEIVDINNMVGAKNLLQNNAITQVLNGLTFTVNTDGTITVSGTATATTFFEIYSDATKWLENGNYILSGCPANGGSETYCLIYEKANSARFVDYGNGAEVVVNNDSNGANVKIRIGNGTIINNLVFKPMIRVASINDDSYVPYAPSNKQLTYLSNLTQIGSTGVYYRRYLRFVELYINKTVNITNMGIELATLPSNIPKPAQNILAVSGNTLDPSYPNIQIFINSANNKIFAQAWSTINNVNVRAHIIYLA